MTIPIANHPNPTTNHAVWFDAVCRSMWCDNGRGMRPANAQPASTQSPPSLITFRKVWISEPLEAAHHQLTGHYSVCLCIWAWNGSWKNDMFWVHKLPDISHASVVTCNQTTWKCIQMYTECTSSPCWPEECHQAGHGDHRGYATGAMGDVWSLDVIGCHWMSFAFWANFGHWALGPFWTATCRQAERLSLLALLIAQHLSEAAPHERVLLLGPYANVRPTMNLWAVP